MILRCERLGKRYGRRAVLADVSLEVRQGEVLGLLGPNGAGKSTLIKLMTGLIWPTSGRVLVHGHDVHGEHAQAMARLGAIIEWPAFLPELTARQNLAMLSGGYGADYRRRQEEIVALVGMTAHLDRRVSTYSTGMKQRLGIALALLPDSELVILDEPTNGLDPNGMVEMRELIRKFNRELGVTVLVSSHLLGEIEQICHRVAILHQGRLRCCESLEQLLARRASGWQLRCDAPAAAVERLRAAGREAAVADDGAVWLEGCDAAGAAAANRLLNEAGFQVWHLACRQPTLEEFFLSEVQG